MPRPLKCRKIGFTPDFYFFKPAGIPGSGLEEVILTIDEFEAFRLADLEGLYQDEAALNMNVSRQTFGNIICSARSKIADAIINGKILKIDGGKVKMNNVRNFVCPDCRHEWSVPFGTGRPENCPSCKSTNIHRSEKDRGYNAQNGRGRRHRYRHGQGNCGHWNSKN